MRYYHFILAILLFSSSCQKEDDGEPNKVFIKSVNGSVVTIKNGANGIQDLTAWTIGDSDDPIAFTLDTGVFLNQQAQISYTASQMGFSINSGETIILKNNFGNTLDTFDVD